jgi:hypothetical protein
MSACKNVCLRKSLLGKKARKDAEVRLSREPGQAVIRPNGFARYFAPAAQIVSFTSSNTHF